MDSIIMARQKPIDTLLSEHDNQPGDQSSVSSAPGYEVDESEEGASENDIAISIKGSKSTSSSQYGSHANESAFLQTTRTGYDLMIQLMSDMGVTMDVGLK